MGELSKDKAVGLLNRILEQELAGVVRYTHYSLLVFGFNRIPIVEWLRAQATESLTHAQQAGEMITHLGAYPSLTIGPLLDTHRTDIGTILRESLASEGQALALYKELLLVVEGKSVMLEEYARQMVQAEELHAGDVDKMLRQPGEVAAFRPGAANPRLSHRQQDAALADRDCSYFTSSSTRRCSSSRARISLRSSRISAP
jgi:bacterioferritin